MISSNSEGRGRPWRNFSSVIISFWRGLFILFMIAWKRSFPTLELLFVSFEYKKLTLPSVVNNIASRLPNTSEASLIGWRASWWFFAASKSLSMSNISLERPISKNFSLMLSKPQMKCSSIISVEFQRVLMSTHSWNYVTFSWFFVEGDFWKKKSRLFEYVSEILQIQIKAKNMCKKCASRESRDFRDGEKCYPGIREIPNFSRSRDFLSRDIPGWNL